MTYNAIILMGLKHSGKSTLGKGVAEKLGFEFVDTDELIEKAAGMSVRDLYNKKGVEAFMIAEEEVCKELVESLNERKLVISTGGGICDNQPALFYLKGAGDFIFLQNDIDLSVKRIVRKIGVGEDGKFVNVPAFVQAQHPETLVDIKKILRAKFQERAEVYKKLSDITVLLEDASIEENVQSILNAIR